MNNLIKSSLNTAQNAKTCINLDWLQYYGVLESGELLNDKTQIFDNVVCVRQGYGVSGWKNTFEIFVDGESAAFIFTNPRLDNLPERAASVKIVNDLLYTDYWAECFLEICEKISYKPKNVTRLDIALDGTNYMRPFLSGYFNQTPKNKHVYQIGKAQWSSYWHDDTSMMSKRFSLGSTKSNKVVAIYCKTDEIKKSGKTYILKNWEKAGLDYTSQPVYRTEIRFKSQALKAIEDFNLNELSNIEYQKSLLRTGITGFLKFTVKPNKSSDTNIRRYPEAKLFDWSKIGGALLSKTERIPTTDVYKAKMMIHKLTKDQIIYGDDDLLESVVQRYVGNFDIEDWYTMKLDEWKKEYEAQRLEHEFRMLLNQEKKLEKDESENLFHDFEITNINN